MSEDKTRNIVEYLIFCIGAFAGKHGLTNAQSYRYLHLFKGLDFLLRHYEVEHTLPMDDAIDDITAICKRNGGRIE